MNRDVHGRREHYLERIKSAEDAAAKATDQTAVEGWKRVAEGYRLLLGRLPAVTDTEH